MEKNIGKYELLYIVHPDLESSIDKITDRTRAFIESRGGKITYEENWGKRKLAYFIKKTDVGLYLLWYFEIPKTALAKIERDLHLTEEIIRYLLLSIEDKPKVTKSKKKKEVNEVEVKKEVTEEEEKIKDIKTTPKVKAPTKKIVAKKKEIPVKVESEEERMKVLDEKLGAILGDEDDNKEDKEKETK